MSNWTGLTKEEEKIWSDLCDEFVPFEGSADTIGGEIMRAINKIVYRWNNDGDTCDYGGYSGCEYNYCQGANLFLKKQGIPGYKTLYGIRGESAYDKAVKNNLKIILDYLVENPELFNEPNKEDYEDYAPEESYGWD